MTPISAICGGLFSSNFSRIYFVLPGRFKQNLILFLFLLFLRRSVAGSYDNEGIAIFCMLFTYYLWIKARVQTNVSLLAFFAYLRLPVHFHLVGGGGVDWGGSVAVFLIAQM
jgi:hypothetical protein